jgi:hypothetical protein
MEKLQKSIYIISLLLSFMRYIIHLALVLMCILYTAGAIEYIDSLQNAVENYNKNLDSAPDSIKNLLENERVSIAIPMDDGSLLNWGFETKNERIVSYAQGNLKNPSIEVYATENAINDVLKSTDPADSYMRAEKAGNIRITGKTIVSSLKLRTALVNTNDLKSFLCLIKP